MRAAESVVRPMPHVSIDERIAATACMSGDLVKFCQGPIYSAHVAVPCEEVVKRVLSWRFVELHDSLYFLRVMFSSGKR